MAGNTPQEATALARQLRAADPDKPLSFAFAAAKTPEDSVLVIGSKGGSALESEAKRKAGNGARVFSGLAYAEGSKAVFASDAAPSSAERSIADWVRHHKLGLGVNVTKDFATVTEDEEETEGPKIYATETLIRRFRMALRGPVHFAFGPGKSVEEHLLALHPRRDGKMLFRGIRQQNKAIRGSWGTLGLDGRVATFTCEEKPIPGLRKQIRAFLRDRDLRYRVLIMGPEGEVVEPGDEEDEDEDAPGQAPPRTDAPPPPPPQPGTGAPTPGTGQTETQPGGPPGGTKPRTDDKPGDDGVRADAERIATMRSQVQRMLPTLLDIAKALSTRGADIRDQHQKFQAAVKAKNVSAAQDAFDALREHGTAGRQDVAALATMRERVDAQLPELRRLFQARPDDAEAIRRAWQRCDTMLKLGDVRAARPAMFELASIMRAAQDADARARQAQQQQGTPGRSAPADTPVFRRLVVQRVAEWRDARKEAAATLDRLTKAVLARDDVQAHPRLADVRKAMADLAGELPDFGGRLETMLETAAREGTVSRILGDARGVIGDYRRQLSGAKKLSAFESFARTQMNDNADLVGALDANLNSFDQMLARAG